MSVPSRTYPILITTLSVVLAGLCLELGDGVAGLVYAAFFLLLLAPGLPLGWYLFGRQHVAGWIAGAVLGYALSAFAFWIAIAAGFARPAGFAFAWTFVTGGSWGLLRARAEGQVRLPPWTSGQTTGLLVLLLLVPAVVGMPLARIGSPDVDGSRRYRAYFTADFLWHMALTAELEKFERPPRNPYLASEPLHYYWLSFVPPAAAGTVAVMPAREGRLAINMLLTGLLLVAAVDLAAWSAIGRAGPATAAVALAFLAASAEGLYVAIGILRHGGSFAAVRDLNIDAITYWVFHGFTIDGLPRAILYNPQHSLACALGVLAVTVAGAVGSRMTAGLALASGTALGLALMVSPFPAGALTLIYGLVVAVDLVLDRHGAVRRASVALAGVLPIAGALAWDVANRVFEGAAGDLRLGLHPRAVTAPGASLALGLGPLLVPVLIGVAAAWRFPRPFRPALVGLVLTLGLIFCVSLRSADVWVGWRAGQVLLVTVPALAALGLSTLASPRFRGAGYALAGLLFAAGLPTTVFDVFNAQDVENRHSGPGFPWVVVVSRPERQALDWIRDHTSSEAIVQMDPISRGRDTWTLIPSFAERRMSAGLPISLIDAPVYHEKSEQVGALFATTDPQEAWKIATSLGITYLYLGPTEQAYYPAAEAMMRSRPDLFQLAYRNRAAVLYRRLR